MTTLHDLARDAQARLRPHIQLPAAQDVMAKGRRRKRRRRTASAVALAAAAVALGATVLSWRQQAKPEPAQEHVLDEPIVLDDAALTLDRPGSATPAVTLAEARQTASAVVVQPMGSPERLVLARATARVQDRPGSEITQRTWDLAWVHLFRMGRWSASCPPGPPRSPAPSPDRPTDRNALIIDAYTGEAMIYLGYGVHICPPEQAPRLVTAFARFSVAFDEQPDGSLLVHLPPCASLEGAIQGPAWVGNQVPYLADRELRIHASAPIGPCAARAGTTKRFGERGWRKPIVHGPVGQEFIEGDRIVVRPPANPR